MQRISQEREGDRARAGRPVAPGIELHLIQTSAFPCLLPPRSAWCVIASQLSPCGADRKVDFFRELRNHGHPAVCPVIPAFPRTGNHCWGNGLEVLPRTDQLKIAIRKHQPEASVVLMKATVDSGYQALRSGEFDAICR